MENRSQETSTLLSLFKSCRCFRSSGEAPRDQQLTIQLLPKGLSWGFGHLHPGNRPHLFHPRSSQREATEQAPSVLLVYDSQLARQERKKKKGFMKLMQSRVRPLDYRSHQEVWHVFDETPFFRHQWDLCRYCMGLGQLQSVKSWMYRTFPCLFWDNLLAIELI